MGGDPSRAFAATRRPSPARTELQRALLTTQGAPSLLGDPAAWALPFSLRAPVSACCVRGRWAGEVDGRHASLLRSSSSNTMICIILIYNVSIYIIIIIAYYTIIQYNVLGQAATAPAAGRASGSRDASLSPSAGGTSRGEEAGRRLRTSAFKHTRGMMP